MFKKLKDKLAEEVKSSPQRIQQFAQAAQAAVTSASSSISDITNSDLFTIGDTESLQTPQQTRTGVQKNTYQDVSLVSPSTINTSTDSMEFMSSQDITDNQRQRRLSNSSFASDVSFRLPSYESPSMYHLQSDMEISASEAEERSFSGPNISLDRVTKEQIYGAYRRTQERYKRYRTQYADLARHYKLLERENAKAKSVLVETQDKALRRISELREQCTLEQSAKAHLEKALRVELEEKNLKIDTLNTKIKLLQSNDHVQDDKEENFKDNGNNVQLISFDSEHNHTSSGDSSITEIANLNNKIEKLEKLVNKYKESLKTIKEKNAQLTTETQVLSNEVENKNKELEQLKVHSQLLEEAKQKIQKLNEHNEELQNSVNLFEFNKNKEKSTLELDFEKAQEEVTLLKQKISVFIKREEEYAISLAENKLSIHKELESKENEIKSLKDLLSQSKQEILSLTIVIDEYKNKISTLESDSSKLRNEVVNLNSSKTKISELETQLVGLTQKNLELESIKMKAEEEYKCLQLQLKQETAEKLAMIDRNVYLENRNTQVSEENVKKTSQIAALDNQLQSFKEEQNKNSDQDNFDKEKLLKELDMWRNKCTNLESEIQEEREELVKLQSEIEKLLANDDRVQMQNTELNKKINELNSDNKCLQKKLTNMSNVQKALGNCLGDLNYLKSYLHATSEEIKILKSINWNNEMVEIKKELNSIMEHSLQKLKVDYAHGVSAEQQRLSEHIIDELKEKDKELNLKSEEYDKKENVLNEKLNQITELHNHVLKELTTLQHEKQVISDQYNELLSTHENLKNILDHNNNQQAILKQNVAELTEKLNTREVIEETMHREKETLIKQLENAQNKFLVLQNGNDNQHSVLQQQIMDINEKYEALKGNYEHLLSEKLNLVEQLEKSRSCCQELQNTINQNSDTEKSLKEELDSLVEKLTKNAYDNEVCKAEINKIETNYENKITELNQLKDDNAELSKKLENTDDYTLTIKKLQNTISELSLENVNLRNQSEEITNGIKELEEELSEVRKSHAEIEIEKDHLNFTIEQLAKSEREKDLQDKVVQTSHKDDLRNHDEINEEFEDVKLFEDLSQTPKNENNLENDDALKKDNYTLREENKRLHSDIAGLQTYLAKISKENSDLNDKMREIIASGGNTGYNQSDIEKEKLNDIMRENMLLVEENLELKDQINSQNYVKPIESSKQENANDDEHIILKDKYTNLKDINNRLENRMLDLEQMNKSMSGNMSQMQEHNEKLKLSNEKMERRLDEALVSLRHLHSLQENTELEYLRNVLYEYLTGTGAHSITLAKVLAAVVKFDPTQTKEILLKEKERQGFLRQLGLL